MNLRRTIKGLLIFGTIVAEIVLLIWAETGGPWTGAEVVAFWLTGTRRLSRIRLRRLDRLQPDSSPVSNFKLMHYRGPNSLDGERRFRNTPRAFLPPGPAVASTRTRPGPTFLRGK